MQDRRDDPVLLAYAEGQDWAAENDTITVGWADEPLIARNSSFTYRNRAVDAKQIGRELGVRYILSRCIRGRANLNSRQHRCDGCRRDL